MEESGGADIGGILADTSNFLDSGLATLGVVTAWVHSTVKGRLDFEIALREATYLSHRTLQLSPAEKLTFNSASFHEESMPHPNDLVVPFALFTTGECHHMDKILSLWMVNRTGASVVTVICNRYSDSVNVLDCCSPSHEHQQVAADIDIGHACRCLLIPSTFVDRHDLWSKDTVRCRPYGDNQALVLCAACLACTCHGLQPIHDPAAASSSTRPIFQEYYWQSITQCLDNLDNQHGALILADADSSLGTLHFLRRCAVSGDEAARRATTPILDILHHRDVCDSLRFTSGFMVHNPFRYGILCIIEAFIQLARVATLHLDAFTAGLVARRMMRAYVGDSTGAGSTLELLFSHIHIGNDAFKVFAAGFAVDRITIWRFAMIFSVRVTSGLLSLALWCYVILAKKTNFFFSNAYTMPPAVWALWYSVAVAVIQAATGCVLLGYSLARVIHLPRSNFLLLVALSCAAQMCYCVLGILKATAVAAPRGRIGTSIPVALEMVVTFHWFVCSVLLGNNPRKPIHGKEKLISLWYSLTFLQLSALTSMGGNWK